VARLSRSGAAPVTASRKWTSERPRRAKPARSLGVEIHREMRPMLWRLLGTFVGLAIISSACGSRPRVDDSPLFGTGVFHPPPKPGASISQTRMCECQVCEPSDCCDGPADDTPPATCGSSGDAQSDELCGIAIRSCASRCTREVWRVNNAESCSAKRPTSCCRAG